MSKQLLQRISIYLLTITALYKVTYLLSSVGHIEGNL